MINVVVEEDSLPYLKGLINKVIGRQSNIKILNILSNGLELLDILKKDNNIDLILLDLQMPKLNGIDTLDEIYNLQLKKCPKVIIISAYSDLIAKVINHPLVIDFIHKGSSINDIYDKLEKYEKDFSFSKISDNLSEIVMEELLYIGYNASHLGTKYIKECILELYKDNSVSVINKLEQNIYARVACMNNKSVENLKINIIKATNFMYLEANMDRVKDYFNFSDIRKKPTPKIVIYTVLNKLEQKRFCNSVSPLHTKNSSKLLFPFILNITIL